MLTKQHILYGAIGATVLGVITFCTQQSGCILVGVLLAGALWAWYAVAPASINLFAPPASTSLPTTIPSAYEPHPSEQFSYTVQTRHPESGRLYVPDRLN